jgi:dolichyl-phosphate-mannose--protein O-mannosyl transferase
MPSTLLRRYGFSLSLLAIFLGALGLRLWGLSRINQLAFDEVHYAQYGVNYLTQRPVFDAHPPLGKYLIALGIWLGENVLFRGAEIRNDASGLDLSPLSYRWLNAVVGALLPPLIAGVALQLTGRRRLAVLAGLFAAADGFLLVESRFALLHVYLDAGTVVLFAGLAMGSAKFRRIAPRSTAFYASHRVPFHTKLDLHTYFQLHTYLTMAMATQCWAEFWGLCFD